MSLQRVARIREKGGEFLPLLPSRADESPADVAYEAVTGADTAEFASMMLANAPYLLDAADALDNLHLRICGCDSPGQVSYCSFDDFAALVPLQVDG